MSWFSRWKERRRVAAELLLRKELCERASVATRQSNELTDSDREAVTFALSEFLSGRYEVIEEQSLTSRLADGWNSVQPPKATISFLPKGSTSFAIEKHCEEQTRFSAEGELKLRWHFAMTQEFSKSVSNIDRKLQGRILEAIAQISSNPVEARGDTIRPLANEMRGLWRYRLGDYRLIYQPFPERKQIVLITFAGRGSVYS